MAFGFIKKIGRAIGSAGKAVYSVVKKVPKPIKEVIYETAVPASVREVAGKVVSVAKYIPGLKSLVKGDTMNPLEKAFRELADVVNALKDGAQYSDINEVIEALVAIPAGFKAYNEADLEGRIAMAKEALDNMIGTEEDALIGPNGSLLKIDLPLVDDEAATDMLMGAIEAIVRKNN